MDLNEKLLNLLCEITENVGWLDRYARNKHAVLDYIFNKGLIDSKDIDAALKAGVVIEAQNYCKQLLVSKRSYADDIFHPEFLAYAISNCELTSEEISRIPFAYEETVTKFIKSYHVPNLIEKLRHKLLNPKPLHSHNFSTNDTSCDSCCSC